jgi:hypothetical protein
VDLIIRFKQKNPRRDFKKINMRSGLKGIGVLAELHITSKHKILTIWLFGSELFIHFSQSMENLANYLLGTMERCALRQ